VPDTTWLFYVDIVSGCNLACPSCPIGNSRDVPTAKGFMSPELLDRIVRKSVDECGRVEYGLYNWTEPFLHPDLPAMVRRVQSRGIPCSLSTNLNIIRELDAVLQENPAKIKISLSGFDVSTYEHTHRNGDIERVKRNLAELAAARERTRSATRIVVGFHRYLGNHADESRMRALAQSLGFDFEPQWAYLMPLEKVLAFADPSETDVVLADEDRRLIDKLALPLDGALRVSRNSPPKPCQLRARQMSLNVRGEVMLCCVVYDQKKYSLGSYLDLPLAALQEMKYRHPQCGPCMRNGLHKLFTYEDGLLDQVGLDHVRANYPDAELGPLLARPERRQPSGLHRAARRVRGWIRRAVGR
jgi:MoaA/NifB/PqqE/SkfB family radical SAM enzyme